MNTIDEEDLEQGKIEFLNSEEIVMIAFIDWLQSMDGSDMKEKDAKAQASHVIAIKGPWSTWMLCGLLLLSI